MRRFLVALLGAALVVIGFALFIIYAADVFTMGEGGQFHGLAFLLIIAGGLLLAGAIISA